MDSLELDQFLKNNTAYQDYTEQFNDFYKDRNYAYAWFDSSGLSEQASNFRNLQLNFISSFEDSSLYHPEMEQLLERFVSSNKKNKPADSLVLKAELLLTGQFFRYAAKVYKGSDIDAAELGWFIPRKKIDLHALLDSAILHKNEEAYAPQNQQYKKLQQYVERYSALAKQHSPDPIPPLQKSLRSGDSSAILIQIKKHLQLVEILQTESI